MDAQLCFENPDAAAERIAALEAEVDALRKDAERYRWLCECCKHVPWGYFLNHVEEVGIDAAIDAVMKEAQS